MKRLSLLFATMLLLLCVGYAQVSKRNPNPGEIISTSAVDYSSELTNFRGDYFPLLYATSPNATEMAVYKTTVGSPGNTDPALAKISVEYQSMERVGDDIYVITYNPYTYSNSFGKIDPVTGAFTLIRESADDGFMAWNPVTNEMYISMYSDYGYGYIGKFDIETGTFTYIGSLSGVYTIAIDNDGICYALSFNSSDSRFGTINLSNGNFNQISIYPDQLAYMQNLSIDRGTNELYHAARIINMSSSPTPWRKINKTTGAITNLGTFPAGRNVESFCILNSPIPADAPGAVTNLTATPGAVGALTAVLNWNNPSISAGGTPLSQITSVAVYQNNLAIPVYTHPTPAPGSADTYTVTVPSNGLYNFKVVASNVIGEGIPENIEVWIGPDVPAVPSNVQFSVNNFNATLTWVAPTAGLHGGYYLPTGLVYDVYRLPDNVKVSSDQTGTTFAETITMPGNYSYKVVAKNSAGEGGAGLSNALLLCPAAATFPFQEGFENNGTNLPACWEQELLWHEVEWSIIPASTGLPATAHSGAFKAIFYPEYWSGAKARLSTPQLNISALTNPVLKFWHVQQAYYGDQDVLRVYYKTSSGGAWALLEEYTTEIADWTEHIIALPNKSADYYIGFEGTGGWGRGVHLDDITVFDFVDYVDAELLAITEPPAGTSINLTNNESVTVIIKNNGSDPITGFPVSLEHNGTPIATETFTGSINSLSQGSFTFAAKLDLSAAGDHFITATVSVPGDEMAQNDSKTITATNLVCEPITNFPLLEGFEGETFPPDCWFLYTVNKNTDTWIRNTETYIGSHSGQASAFQSATFDINPQESWLVTPPLTIPNTGNLVLEFWSKNPGAYWHEYAGIWVSTTGNNPAFSTFTELKELTGDEISNDTWVKIEVSLSNDYVGQTIYVAFKYTGQGADSWAIDDIRILDFSGFVDGELFSITAPPAGASMNLTNSEPVSVVIANNSSEAISGFEMILELDGVVKATETFAGTIPSLQQANFTFATTLDLSAAGTYQIKVTVNVPGDVVPANNSKTITVKNVVCSVITQYPFTEDFEDDVFPPYCWSIYSTPESTVTWQRNTDEYFPHHSGNAHAFHRYGSGDQDGWLITPPMAIGNTGDFMLEFWSYTQDPGYNYYSGIWISTTNNNPASFTEIKKLSGNEISDNWKKIQIPLNDFADQTIYIAFRYQGNFADYWHIDDVSVTGSGSGPTCPPITTFPYTQNFEGATFPPECWDVHALGGSETWAKNTEAEFVHSGSASAGHTAFTPGFLQGWLVMPQITVPNTGHYLLEFWSFSRWPQYHSDGYAGVWVSTSSANPVAGTFFEYKELTGNDISDAWKKIIIPLSNDFAGETIYIAFKYEGNWADIWYIDDVSVYELNLVDAELLAITTPTAGVHSNLTNSEPVSVVIKNNGNDPISGFEVILELDGVVKATETFTGTILPINQADFTFATTLDLSAVNMYEITVTVNLPNDEISGNDSKTIMVRNVSCSVVNEFPFTEGFEDNIFPPACWTLFNSGGPRTWERTTMEKHLGEASAQHWIAVGMQESWLVSPPIEIPNSGNFRLEFWSYHLWSMFNMYNGVWISTTGNDPATSTFTEIKHLTGTELEDEVWTKISIPISNTYAGETVYFAFKYAGDMADFWFIDDILIYNFDGYIDGEIVSIITPSSGEGLTTSEPVKVLIQNNGSAPITGFNVKLELDGAEIATETYTGSIPSLGQAEYTFNATLDLSELKTYEVKVTVIVAGDPLPINDFKIKKVANFSPEVVQLFGYRIYDNDFSSPPYGFISFHSNNPVNITKVNNYLPAPPATWMHAGEFVNGYFYTYTINEYSPVNFVKISTNTWTDVAASPVTANPIDMAYDFTTEVMYGIELTPDGTNLVTINMTTGAMTPVGLIARDLFTLACSNDGDLCAIDRDGNLCAIDKANAAITVISNTGILPYYIQSMAFDHNTGRLFWAMCNTKDEGKLVELDPATGVAFVRGSIAGEAELIGLYTIGQVETYTVSVSANPTEGGTVTGGGDFLNGETATINASPNIAYNFINWTEDGTPVATNPQYSFTVTKDRTFVANFQKKTYTITATAGANGTIDPIGETTVNYGEDQTFTITPNPGYEITQVLVDGTNNPAAVASGSYTFENVTANHTISASFGVGHFELTLDPSTGTLPVGAQNPIPVTFHAMIGSISNASQPNCPFKGWFI
ncbi:MAG: choice-of-anchor J domain-containing protein, partial [Bacteroidales bacterium]|nr:choice-of-anchor J domain-containing protein [Bacteroidales bacterium]